MSKYYIEYGALQANGKRLIECETSALEARKITEEFAREIADALNGREAWKREKAEAEADALAVGGIVEAARHTPGNAAAMREALVQCELFLGNVSRHGHPTLNPGDKCTACDGGDELRGMVACALSAPARQCDVGTAEEQDERFRDFCPKYTVGGLLDCEGCRLYGTPCADCALAWAQMPYEAKEGGAD